MGHVQTYAYDARGNETSKTDPLGHVTTYTYDANDRLLTENAMTYTYDNNGNTLSKVDGSGVTAYAYTYENRLAFVRTPDGEMGYAYDDDGIRVSAVVDGVTTNYFVDKNRPYAQVLEESDGTGSIAASYLYGYDLIRQNRNGQVNYYIYDDHGSVRQLIDPSGAVTDTYSFDGFGVELNRTGSTVNNYLYAGEQLDPNIGFYYLRARYYSQDAGRFLTTDPFHGNIFDPVLLYKYLYANANPVIFTDPSGMVTIYYLRQMRQLFPVARRPQSLLWEGDGALASVA
jgi:RHS repeat-associated protein